MSVNFSIYVWISSVWNYSRLNILFQQVISTKKHEKLFKPNNLIFSPCQGSMCNSLLGEKSAKNMFEKFGKFCLAVADILGKWDVLGKQYSGRVPEGRKQDGAALSESIAFNFY